MTKRDRLIEALRGTSHDEELEFEMEGLKNARCND